MEYSEYMHCTQGQGGSYSHQGNHYYAFDFDLDDWQNNSSNDVFGINLYSPVNGTIVDLRDGVMDFQNNSSSNVLNNYGWGNTLLIWDEGNQYAIRMSHLRYGTTDHLMAGDLVKMHDYIGQIGQTGYSTNPHLHIEVRRTTSSTPDIANVESHSTPFTFAEGKVYTDEWIKSGLSYNMSMLDNNGETTLSNMFDTAYTYYSGTQWLTKLGTYGYAGKDMRRDYVSSSTSSNYFTWEFSVKQSGLYGVFVTFEDAANQDPNAEYSINGSKARNLTQKTGGHFYKYIGMRYFSAGTMYTVSVRGTTPGTYVVADAVVLRKFG
ncbi:peptidoglycan DD-metalloendopeptidase family protein [Patescibacteria group bacterium]